ncbi:hypothetical protein V8E54_002863 [Elaphomyces granulatus]
MEPLLDRTAHGLIRKPLEIHSASPIHLQLSTAQVPLRCWDVYLNLNTRAAAILLAASDMHNRGFVEYLERGSKVVLRHSVRRPPGGRGYYGGVSLRQHVLPVSRTTRRKMVRDSYGIPSGRRSSNGPIKAQGVVREMVRVSEWACISSISPMT